MGITGNLKTMQLGELFQWLSLGSKTGTLLIDGHGVEKRVYFQDGRIASTSSSDQREYLGHFLVSHGYISEEELKMAMEVQEESQILLGKILVMINAIAEADLLRLMRKKAEESIYDVFLWTEGSFEFVDGDLPDQKMVPLSLDVTGIIMEGMRRYDELQRASALVPDGARFRSTQVRPTHLPLEEDPGLPGTVWGKALSGATAVDCEAAADADAFRVRRLIVHWVEEGSLQVVAE